MAAHQFPPSLGFSRQEHWSGLPFPSPMHESEKWKWSCSVMSHSLWLHLLQPTRFPRPWDPSGKNTGVGCHCLLRPLQQNVLYWFSPHCLFGAAIWDVASRAEVLILPQIKLNSQLSSCISFFSRQYCHGIFIFGIVFVFTVNEKNKRWGLKSKGYVCTQQSLNVTATHYMDESFTVS